ncbi:MAG TPA: hypothetical protein VGQ12_17870 [Candidatus Angelobacter sp.]|jgi:hypothetical protein|nr:hypothetical protein [Candidatus Angelobacter sp.]
MSTPTIPPPKEIVSAQKPADEARQANFSLALVDKVDTVLKPFAELASQGIKVLLIGIGGFILPISCRKAPREITRIFSPESPIARALAMVNAPDEAVL